ncbi:CHAT domain-containing protein [Amycolatopsis azurea DSM 43854]|uniref:CHAT domain-containing protein n=1 Tax=Amycolatopsis azurea DSM 43854 TaxID=1238180 RepID=A0ABX3J4G6_9PSEU|nr:CHAT domain-containing protein [Amycolatopsis azurea DSM 43854]
MNTCRGAAVTIRIAAAPGGTRITCKSALRGVLDFTHVLEDSAIGEARKELNDGLTALKRAQPDLHGTGDPRHLQELAEILGETGRTMIFLLFGHEAEEIRALQIFWEKALPAWRNRAYLPVIECLGDEKQLLPLEFLPLLDMNGCDREIADGDDFVKKLRAFIGFSCVVRRRLKLPVHDENPVLATTTDGKLRIRYLQHDGLKGAKAELAWLTSEAAAKAAILGPLPSGPLDADEFAQRLFDPDAAECPDTAPALEHFACHCYTSTRTSPLKYELQLRGGGSDLRVTLRDLAQRMVSLASPEQRRPQDMPLVVLNACGGSMVDAMTSIGFPKLFLGNGNRGFLGSEIAIPDDFAAAFSEEFYRGLLLDEKPFGQSVHLARERLLTSFLNPLGLAYVAYGNTDLRTAEGKAGADARRNDSG